MRKENPIDNFSIGIVALSLPSIGERRMWVDSAIGHLKNSGYRVYLGQSVHNASAYKSGTIEMRVNDLHAMFKNKDINLILNTTGGYNSNELLEYLDFEIIKENPKWFVGYSDITAINLALHKKSNLKTVNGPMLVDYLQNRDCFTKLFETLNATAMEYSNSDRVWEWDLAFERKTPVIKRLNEKKESSTGRIIVGNLSTFNLMIGTPYMPDLTGKVLFLEYDVEEKNALASLERFLWQQRQAGFLKELSGLVFGLLPHTAVHDARSIKQILMEVTDGYEFPVLYDAQFGHIYPSWSLVNGDCIKLCGCQIRLIGK